MQPLPNPDKHPQEDLHHYKIDVESQEDVGSVFTVYIPYEMFTGLTKKKKD